MVILLAVAVRRHGTAQSDLVTGRAGWSLTLTKFLWLVFTNWKRKGMPMSQGEDEVEQDHPFIIGSEEDIDVVLDLCGDDARAAIRTLIIENENLRQQCERLRSLVSRGFTRSK